MKKINVIFLEDDHAQQVWVKSMFEKEDYIDNINVFSSIKETIRALKFGAIDGIVTDNQVIDGDVIDHIDEIKKYTDKPIILITATFIENIPDDVKSKFDMIIEKPAIYTEYGKAFEMISRNQGA